MIPPISLTSSGPGLAEPSWRAGGQASISCPRSLRARLRVRPLVCALSAAVLVTTAAGLLASRLTRNYTPSLPLGVYLLRPGLPVSKGSLVDFEIPRRARDLIAGRYLPARFHLLKRVVALEGDAVCFADGQLSGRRCGHLDHRAPRLVGRPLPRSTSAARSLQARLSWPRRIPRASIRGTSGRCRSRT